MRFKKIISTFIVLSMLLQMFYVFPASAEVGNNLYKYEDYSVEYNVINEWDGGQTVEIKIINTGTESILNWAVKYDIDGEISNLWNAQVYDSKDNTYIFKNCGWNYEIRPNEYVTFGYTIKNHTFSMPEKFISCSERETLTLGYSVDLNIISEWDTGAQGEIVVTNTSTEPLEAWVLSFDSTFSIDNLWNARVLSNENNHYSVASESWTNPIEVGESKVIGFVASKTTEAQLEIANYSLSVIKINNNLNESDSLEDDKILDKLIISAYGGYVAETDSIDIFWMSTISDGTFKVLVSEDNIKYTVIKTVTDTDGCSIKVDLTQKYIKIKQTANDQTAESQPLVVTKTGNGYIIDYTDIDNDGLYDYIEEAVGSDKLLSDTDNDGLSDYEEVYLTNTDPAVYNSVESDLSDAEADSDNDGLSNYDEIVLETMPLNDDSDEDGLIDGDEINQHDTDPLKYDTDNDGICDGDEIILGLDPNNDKTNGVLDCEYTTIQILDSNNNIFGDINTEENSYSISLELCISGLADTNLEVRESGYSEIVQNDAILGSVLELDYPDDLLVDDVKINFEIKDEYIKNSKSISYDEFKGIKRLNVFRYFEEMNMLLPIESFHDTKTNTVYAETDMLGTYCLIDMEVWLDNIGITSEYSSNITTATLSENIVDENSEYTATEYQAKSENITSYENTYSTNVQEETFVIVLEPVVEFSDEIRDEYFHNAVYKCASDIDKEYEKYKIYILDSKGNILTSPYGLSYATSLYDVHCICTNYSYSDICGDSVQSTGYFYALFNSGVVFDKTDFAKLLSGMYLQDRNLAEFLLLPSTQFKENMTFSNESQHFHIKFAFGLQNKIGYAVKIPHILTATGLTVLPEYFGRVSPDNNLDYDNDGLANNVEIDWNNPLISNGKLPTLETCICTANSSGKLTYVENGLERLRNLPYNEYYGLLKSEILPLTSDPLSEDSDGDGLLDGSYQRNNKGKIIAPKDENPLKYDGPKGVWKAHVSFANSGVPTKLEKWYGLVQNSISNDIWDTITNSLKMKMAELIKNGTTLAASIAGLDLEKVSYILNVMDWRNYVDLNETNSGIEGFETLIGEIIALVMTGDIGINLAEELIALVQAHRLNILLNNSEAAFQDVTSFMTYLGQAAFSDGARASLGSRFLNFKADSENVIHSQFRQWQAIGGYNNGYDAIFRTFTGDNMDREKFPFTIGDMEYIIWIWRGDYLNLGAGAEVGIYSRPTWLTQDPEKLDQYFTDYNLALPMTLSLYNYGEEVESIFQWCPTEKQWWITGFNPEHLRDEVDVNKQAMICSIDFSDNVEMYKELKETADPENEDIFNSAAYDYLLFDDNEYIIWVFWYKRS